ncbi:MAG: sigma-70 family RNA polymerase sigma factor [Akkermansiaceae bacterium]|nr:sigma-70 family RNA polymerase sigma factor [Akkermansiaceae bacterium]
MSEMPALQTTYPSDPDLLTRFAETRDEKAFSTLMQRHWGFVYAIAKRSLTNTALAEDATQQTFITLAKKAKTLRTNRPLCSWLYRTAIHEASNLRRHEMRHQKRNRDYQAISQPDPEPQTQLSAKLHQALSSLSEKDRQLIILRYYQGLTADQIAT